MIVDNKIPLAKWLDIYYKRGKMLQIVNNSTDEIFVPNVPILHLFDHNCIVNVNCPDTHRLRVQNTLIIDLKCPKATNVKFTESRLLMDKVILPNVLNFDYRSKQNISDQYITHVYSKIKYDILSYVELNTAERVFIHGCINLETLICPMAIYVNCIGSSLKTIDCNNAIELFLDVNKLSGSYTFPNAIKVVINNNQLTELICPIARTVICDSNKLTYLDCPSAYFASCTNNLLTELRLDNAYKIVCYHNPLEFIYAPWLHDLHYVNNTNTKIYSPYSNKMKNANNEYEQYESCDELNSTNIKSARKI